MKFNHKDSLLSDEALSSEGHRLAVYVNHLRNIRRDDKSKNLERFINHPFDNQALDEVLSLVNQKVTSQLKYIVLVGVDGSTLATRAVYDALRGRYDEFTVSENPKMIFANTCDPVYLTNLASFLQKSISSPEEVLIIFATKSGKTAESLFTFEFVMSILFRELGDVLDRTVVISNKSSELYKLAQDQSIDTLEVPKDITPRFLPFSALTLFPLAAAGIDIGAYKDGAADVLARSLEEGVFTNPAILSAASTFLSYQGGRRVGDIFLFHPELATFGRWSNLLVSESLSKERRSNGASINIGLTARHHVGPEELHHAAETLLAGPKDKLVTLVWSDQRRHEGLPLGKRIFGSVLKKLGKKTSGEVTDTTIKTALGMFRKGEVPFLEITIPGISEYSLGQLVQFKLLKTLFLGNLFGVDVFTQPNIDEFKTQVRKNLSF